MNLSIIFEVVTIHHHNSSPIIVCRWGEIVCQQFNFDRDVIETDVLKTLTLEDVRQFYRDFIAVDAPQRRKMATLVAPSNEDGQEQKTTKEATKVR